MNPTNKQQQFFHWGKNLFSQLKGNESATLSLAAEETEFTRFNHSLIRQHTWVKQCQIFLKYQKGQKSLEISVQLGWDDEQARELLNEVLESARDQISSIPDDPFLAPLSCTDQSLCSHQGTLPSPEIWPSCLSDPLTEQDLAGISSMGPVYRGLMNSLGMSHWYETQSFSFDYSLYDGENAVKNVYAPYQWKQEELREKLNLDIVMLEKLKRPPKKLEPGKYRCYLGPQAVAEILSLLSWGALSYAQTQRGNSPLLKLWKNERQLSELFSLDEDFSQGLVPRFNNLGESAPEKITLIQNGHINELLTSQRSALQYDALSNKASESEVPRALSMRGGSLEDKDILKKIGTGLYLANLHYLNWSNVTEARLTGMTRFACLWVENGEIVGPIEDMRFDETLYSFFGKHLVELTSEKMFHPNLSTYSERSLGGVTCPGALIDQFTLTL
jgi:predicted Zn-dependent protease